MCNNQGGGGFENWKRSPNFAKSALILEKSTVCVHLWIEFSFKMQVVHLFWHHDTLKKIFSIEKLNLTWNNKQSNFLTNFVLCPPPKRWTILNPHLAQHPQSKWKFKVPQARSDKTVLPIFLEEERFHDDWLLIIYSFHDLDD